MNKKDTDTVVALFEDVDEMVDNLEELTRKFNMLTHFLGYRFTKDGQTIKWLGDDLERFKMED